MNTQSLSPNHPFVWILPLLSLAGVTFLKRRTQ
jgi:hypothetical protein